MSDVLTRPAPRPFHLPAVPLPALLMLALLLVVGLAAVAVRSDYHLDRPDVCGAFTFGRSAFGGCDGFGMPTLRLKSPLARKADGEPVREIAQSYNVSHSTISRLVA
jgi:hypothetical protein